MIRTFIFAIGLSCSQHLAANSEILWQHQDLNLTRDDLNRLGLATEQRPLPLIAAVGLNHHQQIVKKHLENHPNFLLHKSSNTATFAFIISPSLKDLEFFATEAHHQSGGCGHIQLIDPNQTLNLVPTAFFEHVYGPRAQLAAVQQLSDGVDEQNIIATITNLSSYANRKSTTAIGVQAAADLKTTFEAAGKGIPGYAVAFFDHNITTQKSIVASIPGTENDDTTVIIGAHLDSIATGSEAPGADDDASGIASLLEIIRLFNTTQAQFKRRIEFHAYAAEEIGLLGSGDIANTYQKNQRQVAAMLQLDMTSYSVKEDENTIHIVLDDTDLNLRRTLKELLHSYLGGDFTDGSLPPGSSSDHKSWKNAGFATAFPFENTKAFNSLIHTPADTADRVNNLTLAKRITSLSMAFLVHMGGMISAAEEYNNTRSALFSNLTSDLNIAIVTDEGTNQYQLMVATPTNVSKVEICPIASGVADSCSGQRDSLTKTKETASRLVFFNAEHFIDYQSQNTWRIMGYDTNDKLTAVRHIQLAAKP